MKIKISVFLLAAAAFCAHAQKHMSVYKVLERKESNRVHSCSRAFGAAHRRPQQVRCPGWSTRNKSKPNCCYGSKMQLLEDCFYHKKLPLSGRFVPLISFFFPESFRQCNCWKPRQTLAVIVVTACFKCNIAIALDSKEYRLKSAKRTAWKQVLICPELSGKGLAQ